MRRLDALLEKRDAIRKIGLANGADRLWVFGSCARREETPESDVDILAEFRKGATLFSASSLKRSLSELLHCDVDVVSVRCTNDGSEFSRSVRRDMVAI